MSRMDTRVTVWIVDYDLPADNRRRRFYRAIADWMAEHVGTHVTKWSTWSVVITDNPEFADFVYQEAKKIGRAHMYKAEQLK